MSSSWRHRGAHELRTRMLARSFQRLKQPRGFIFHQILTQKIFQNAKKVFFHVVLFLFQNVGVKIYTSNLQLWAQWVIRSAISNRFFKKNWIYVQKVAFLIYFEYFFWKNSNPLQSYGPDSKLSRSKPNHVHLGG